MIVACSCYCLDRVSIIVHYKSTHACRSVYAYVGDYREGSAVVRDKTSGLCFHVDMEGKRSYDRYFWDLGYYCCFRYILLLFCFLAISLILSFSLCFH
jgi:hypothetical protein